MEAGGCQVLGQPRLNSKILLQKKKTINSAGEMAQWIGVLIHGPEYMSLILDHERWQERTDSQE